MDVRTIRDLTDNQLTIDCYTKDLYNLQRLYILSIKHFKRGRSWVEYTNCQCWALLSTWDVNVDDTRVTGNDFWDNWIFGDDDYQYFMFELLLPGGWK